MTEVHATAYPEVDPENAARPETLEEAAGRRLLVSFDALTRVDLALLRLLRTRGHARLIERLVVRYTVTGEHAALWHAIALLGVLLHRGRRRIYMRSIVAIALTQAANFLAKNLIARARPLIEDLPPLVPTISGLSTPSAHASTSFAAASSLSDALPAPPLYLAALVMALSRPYMGVHYPSDSLAGMALGALVAREVRRAHRTLDAR
jgi:membrane-associated phospholipid phosphatase